MSPEVLQKGAMAMPADVYSYAMLMLELWIGDLIYKGVNTHQVRPDQALESLKAMLSVFCSSNLSCSVVWWGHKCMAHCLLDIENGLLADSAPIPLEWGKKISPIDCFVSYSCRDCPASLWQIAARPAMRSRHAVD
jgi:hypothetical protein